MGRWSPQDSIWPPCLQKPDFSLYSETHPGRWTHQTHETLRDEPEGHFMSISGMALGTAIWQVLLKTNHREEVAWGRIQSEDRNWLSEKIPPYSQESWIHCLKHKACSLESLNFLV